MQKLFTALLVTSLAFALNAEDQKRDKKKHHAGKHQMNPDKNNDGVLSQEELDQAVEKVAANFPKMKERFEQAVKEQEKKIERIKNFLAIDKNGDGIIDSSEKEALKAKVEEKFKETQAKMLKKFDANKDGKLDDSEKSKMKEIWAERKAKMLEKYDTDKDGKLNETERQAMREALKNERKSKKKEGGFDKVYE